METRGRSSARRSAASAAPSSPPPGPRTRSRSARSQSAAPPPKRSRRSSRRSASARGMADEPAENPAPSPTPPPPPSAPAQSAGQAEEPGADSHLLDPHDGGLGSDVTLQGLLRRLGAGLDDMFPPPGAAHGRLRQILTVLRGPAEEPARLDSLSQLCDYLSVGSEESMVSFSIDSFVPPLVALLAESNSADVKLLAARALTHLMDALPTSAASIAHNNAAPALCASLLSIEYIDLAEQSLFALEKLSVDFPQHIVRAGGFAAALSFIDFFSTGVQRMAAVTACNLCRAPPPDAMDKIVDVLPAMMNLLNSDDQRIRESAMLGFSRLADSFRLASDKLETLCGPDAVLVERVLSLIVPASPALAPQSYSAALRLLSTLARGSAELSGKLLAAEALVFKLRTLLTDSNSPHSVECLNTADALLPETSPDMVDTTAQTAIAATTSTNRVSRRRRSSSSTVAALAAVDATRRSHLDNNPEALAFLGKTLLPTLMSFYNSSADSIARKTALSVATKFVGLSSGEVLKPLVVMDADRASTTDSDVDMTSSNDTRFAPFVAALLGENASIPESLAGLSLSYFAFDKLPEIKTVFIREGVVHELLRLRSVGEKMRAEAREKEEREAAERQASATAVEASGAVTRTSSAAAGSSAPVTTAVAAENSGGTQGDSRLSSAHDAAVGTSTEASPSDAGRSASLRHGGDTGLSAVARTMEARAASVPSAFHGSPPSSRFPLRLAPLRSSAIGLPEPSVSTVTSVATAIFAKFIGEETALDEAGDSTFARLTEAGRGLTEEAPVESMEKADAHLESVALALGSDSGVSTFEVSRSGIIDALVTYLRASGQSELCRTERTLAFASHLCNNEGQVPFRVLVSRVLGALAAEEKLPICISDGFSSSHLQGASSVSAGLRQLVQPFKLRLVRAPSGSGGTGLRDYSHHVVLIEPLATMMSVQEFLWSRVQSSGSRSDGDEPLGDLPSGARGLASYHNEVNDMLLDEDVAEDDDENRDDHDGMDDDDDELGNGENDDDSSGGEEEAMFEIDDDHDGEHGNDGDEDDEVRRSEEDYSSGSDDVIAEDANEEDDDGMNTPGGFGTDQMGTSLPAVELDHDALAQSPRPSHEARQDGGEAGSRPGTSGLAGSAGGSGSAPSGTRGRRRDGFGGSATSPVGQSRSYAAALAGGMHGGERSTGTGSQAHRRQGGHLGPARLSFTLNGRTVPKDSSILHAVLRSRSDGLSVGPRLWSEVYTLTYSRVSSGSSPAVSDEAAPETTETGSPATAVQPSGGTRATRRSRRLSARSSGGLGSAETPSELNRTTPDARSHSNASSGALDSRPGKKVSREEPSVSDVMERPAAFVPPMSAPQGLPQPVENIVCLLKHLEWIDRVCSMFLSVPEEQREIMPVTSTLVFTSEKIAAKLRRQLSDPLVLCGGAVPAWCHSLARDASFLIPFDTRQVLFQSCALGVPRALHLLQLRADASSVGNDTNRQGIVHRNQAMRDSEARVNRIQRRKVRIHRSRVLESAIRVMTQYAAHGTVLEVEYFDEVGTGLGPTLEFYTLVSRELQRVDLGLWRSQETSKVKVEPTRANIPRSAEIAVPGSSRSGAASASTRSSRIASRSRRRGTSAQGVDGCTPERNDRSLSKDVEYVVPTGNGLMPSCIPTVDTGNVEFAQKLSYFPFMGRLVAKALSDGRLLDLRFSPVFSKLLLAFCRIVITEVGDTAELIAEPETATGERSDLSDAAMLSTRLERITDAELWLEFARGIPGLRLLRDVDPQLASSLQSVLDMAKGEHRGSVDSLCLSFTLPENERIELVPGGRDVDVTFENAEEYVAAVVRYTLCSGVRRQAEGFLRGFGAVLDVRSLLLFQASELELLICGPSFENWTPEFLVQATRCDHGFRHESNAVVYLLRVLSELSAEDQRKFVVFATGSPALPVGGLLSLHPRLTIVKRTPDGGRTADECLPTVMTCTNYFKLPDYSSYEITRSRLLYALHEGQGSFHLS